MQEGSSDAAAGDASSGDSSSGAAQGRSTPVPLLGAGAEFDFLHAAGLSDLGLRLSDALFSQAVKDQLFAPLAAQEAAIASVTSSLVPSLASLASEAFEKSLMARWPTLTDPRFYAVPDPPKAAYSAAMTNPGDFFARDEKVVDSFRGLNHAIGALIEKTGRLTLVWRGCRNAEWGLHSALFRRLMELNGVKPPHRRPKGAQPYPTEDQMVAAEAAILQAARHEWRLDGLSALETFARIQHAGGPTRLLDVTKNPFIATWFAVESADDTEGSDGRLVAFATSPVLKEFDDGANSPIELDAQWSHRLPPWHLVRSTKERQAIDWGTGARRRIWVPAHYDPRILVQNAAFLLDGVPITSSRTQPYFKSSASGKPATYWSRADLLAAASMYVKTANPARAPRANKPNLAPTFTFRITAEAKKEIRDILVRRFGYTRSAIYPDVSALASHVSQMEFPTLDDCIGQE